MTRTPRDGLVSALVNDAVALVNALAGNEFTPQESEAVALLALVAGQDVEPAEGSDGTDGRWKIAQRVAEDRVISTVDPQARHTRKSPEARRDGYRAHLVAEPGTGLITDEELTKAAGPDNSDAAIAETFLANDIADNTQASGAGTEPTHTDLQADGVAEPVRGSRVATRTGDDQAGLVELVRSWFADSAYGTGDLRAAIAAAGHRAVIKPKPLQVAVKGGFSVDDFIVDTQAATVTCPNRITRPISPGRVATFGVACPAHWPPGAPHPRPAGRSSCMSTTTNCAQPAAPGPQTPTCGRSTPSTDPTSNAPSPRSPPAAGAA